MSRAQILAAIITIAIVGWVVLSGERASLPLRGGLGAVKSDTYMQPLGSVREVDVDLRMSAGTLRVQTIGTDAAFEAQITRNAGLRVDVDATPSRLRVTERSRLIAAQEFTNEWVIGLTRRVPVELEATVGAGRSTFDLTGMSGTAEIQAGAGEVRLELRDRSGALDRLELNGGIGKFEAIGLGFGGARRIEARAGVGEFLLDFSGAARDVMEVEIRGGVGRIAVTIPLEAGARVRVRGGAASRVDLQGFTQSAPDEFVNAAWSSASVRIDIRASVGVGAFTVRGGR